MFSVLISSNRRVLGCHSLPYKLPLTPLFRMELQAKDISVFTSLSPFPVNSEGEDKSQVPKGAVRGSHGCA